MSSHTTEVPLRRVVLSGDLASKFTDTIDIDQEGHRLYAGDNWSGGVDIFDISTPEAKFLKTVKIRDSFYGVAVAKDVNKLFAVSYTHLTLPTILRV